MSKDFGIWMKTMRKRKWMSQERLAAKVGVHPNTIIRWELGKQFPPLDITEQIVMILGGELIIKGMENG